MGGGLECRGVFEIDLLCAFEEEMSKTGEESGRMGKG